MHYKTADVIINNGIISDNVITTECNKSNIIDNVITDNAITLCNKTPTNIKVILVTNNVITPSWFLHYL